MCRRKGYLKVASDSVTPRTTCFSSIENELLSIERSCYPLDFKGGVTVQERGCVCVTTSVLSCLVKFSRLPY